MHSLSQQPNNLVWEMEEQNAADTKRHCKSQRLSSNVLLSEHGTGGSPIQRSYHSWSLPLPKNTYLKSRDEGCTTSRVHSTGIQLLKRSDRWEGTKFFSSGFSHDNMWMAWRVCHLIAPPTPTLQFFVNIFKSYSTIPKTTSHCNMLVTHLWINLPASLTAPTNHFHHNILHPYFPSHLDPGHFCSQ